MALTVPPAAARANLFAVGIHAASLTQAVPTLRVCFKHRSCGHHSLRDYSDGVRFRRCSSHRAAFCSVQLGLPTETHAELQMPDAYQAGSRLQQQTGGGTALGCTIPTAGDIQGAAVNDGQPLHSIAVRSSRRVVLIGLPAKRSSLGVVMQGVRACMDDVCQCQKPHDDAHDCVMPTA